MQRTISSFSFCGFKPENIIYLFHVWNFYLPLYRYRIWWFRYGYRRRAENIIFSFYFCFHFRWAKLSCCIDLQLHLWYQLSLICERLAFSFASVNIACIRTKWRNMIPVVSGSSCFRMNEHHNQRNCKRIELKPEAKQKRTSE